MDLAEKYQKTLKRNNLRTKFKVWQTEDDRDLGEPMVYDSPQDITQAIVSYPFFDFGGCVELVIDEEEERCIWHKEGQDEYFYLPTLEELEVEIDSKRKEGMICQI